MASFEFDTEGLAERDVVQMRQQVDSHVFYLVLESKDVASSGYDPIYGEASEAFTTGSSIASTNYIPFQGSILRRSRDSELYRQGFHTKRNMTVDVGRVVEWVAGMLILFEDARYRITDIDDRGFETLNRVILAMEEVT